MISARILAHTKNLLTGDEVVTFECTYHRFILPEVNTYRHFSRNSASSRGIPVTKRIEQVKNNPALPVQWGRNQKGMTASSEISEDEKRKAEEIWREAANAAIQYAEKMNALNVHKQIVNRLLEPFCWQTSVISAMRERFEYMFEQRIHPDAQPEFCELASKMKYALLDSTPKTKCVHLPYILPEEDSLPLHIRAAVSVARCARVSYTPFNMESPNVEEDLRLYSKLLTAEPPHLSPFEHILIPDENDYSLIYYDNFKRFVSYRWIIEQFGNNINFEPIFDSLDDGYKWFE